MIQAFRSFQGNAVVGFIIFLIIVLMQFIVITKGAERVAQVAARFNLDAMPGKQMAIDADLSSGLIDGTAGKLRRQKIQREADFYGAMDGATKIVKRRCGTSHHHSSQSDWRKYYRVPRSLAIPLQRCLNTYSIATVGDGLGRPDSLFADFYSDRY